MVAVYEASYICVSRHTYNCVQLSIRSFLSTHFVLSVSKKINTWSISGKLMEPWLPSTDMMLKSCHCTNGSSIAGGQRNPPAHHIQPFCSSVLPRPVTLAGRPIQESRHGCCLAAGIWLLTSEYFQRARPTANWLLGHNNTAVLPVYTCQGWREKKTDFWIFESYILAGGF